MLELNYQLQAQYNTWINERIYEAAASLSDKVRKQDAHAFFQSIHGTLNHILLGDRIWLKRFAESGHPFSTIDQYILTANVQSLSQELYNDFEELHHQRALTDQTIQNWVWELTLPILESQFVYHNTKGIKREHPFWQAVTHFFNHQTHHRGQVTTLLFQFGKDPGITDLIAIV